MGVELLPRRLDPNSIPTHRVNSFPMQLTNLLFASVALKAPPVLFPKVKALNSNSPESLTLSQTLQSETLETLEWPSLCKQLSSFTSTTMGFSAAQKAKIPLGQTPEESHMLLDQTAAAAAASAMMDSPPLDFSGIEDVSGILNSAVSRELLSISELCAIRRTLRAAKLLFENLKQLVNTGDCSETERYLPLLEILKHCNFQVELEHKIGFCIDCNLLMILDRASEDLEIIRLERKRNSESLDSLLKGVSSQIFQAGAIDRPLITKRRSRMCVSIRASHRHLLPDGVILNVSGSGATYFMEPKEAIELNNMEVKLSNSEKAEEIAILSLLTSEIAESEIEIRYLLDRILEVDLAFARAAYAQWMNGVSPIITSQGCEAINFSEEEDYALSVDIDGIQHPLLLESSLRSSSDVITSNSGNSVHLGDGNGTMTSLSMLRGASDYPVPIDIKIKCGTRVVVISGPNTGGKTASMKTLGVASLMSKAGMFLPAKNRPRIPWFDLVLADIGDHQSLEQSLSTFSGHITRICNILEVASRESLVLIDEIGSGTDPSEGVALSTSILQYLKDCVNLAVVTTHYADLSLLKEKDSQFENAAMEFSLETLQPTYQVLWGSTGNSNALSIAKSIGFDLNIIERAQQWVEQLKPENQQERKGLLYQSLVEERNRLEAQARRAGSLHAEILDLYHEIQNEAEDLGGRETALRAKETQQVQQELKTAKSQLDVVIQEFENGLRIASADQFNSLIKKSESEIASIVEAHCPRDAYSVNDTDTKSYTPQIGEQVQVTGLGRKLATVVEAPEDDETVLVQHGQIKVRVKKSNIRSIASSERNTETRYAPRLKRVSRAKSSRLFQSQKRARRFHMAHWCRHQRTQWIYVVSEWKKLRTTLKWPSLQVDHIRFCLSYMGWALGLLRSVHLRY
ncbi:uncharacterized protein LOC111989695 isoform X2 [Quercus suber]|uniref:uncharacterized protein LOC111989695 isoform X2 n=1 Tax=Quercus suber TaxID=58331 RepID=UPI0032DE2EDC